MFTKIGNLITSPQPREPKNLIAIKIRYIAKEIINRELADLPEAIVKKIQVKTFRNGVLTIASAPLVAAELKMRSGGLIEAMNRGLGVKKVAGIRVRVV